MAAFRSPLIFLGLAILSLALAACSPKSPEEKLIEQRSLYSVEVNQSGFVATPRLPEVEPLPEGEAEDGEEGTEGSEESAEEAMAADMAATMATPEGYDILLDLILSTSSRELLPQVTFDVVHLDSAQREKSRIPVTMDTSTLVRGPGVQVTHKLENVDFIEGDIFYAELRADIPPEERGDYPEFASIP